MPLPQFDISRYLPGFAGNTARAESNISAQLSGMPSTAPARQRAAYFGATSGLPNSGVSNFVGYDLYGQDAERQKQMGLDNLLKMLTGYSGNAFATPGQQMQQSQFDQELQFRKEQAENERRLQQERLDLMNPNKNRNPSGTFRTHGPNYGGIGGAANLPFWAYA